MVNTSVIQGTVQEGVTHLRNGNLTLAESVFREIVLQNANHADANHFLGVIAMERGQTQEATGRYQRAIEVKPNEPIYHNSFGVLLVRCKKYPFAIHHFWQAIALKPDYFDALKNLANAMADIGDHREAIRVAERALRLQPDAADVDFIIARALQRMGNAEESAARYESILKVRPDFTPARTEYGFVCLDRDEFAEAKRHFREAIRSAPKNSRAVQGLGLVHERLGDIEKAVATWERCLEISPNEPQVLSSLGQCCVQVGRIEQGRQYLNQAIRIAPRLAEAHLGLAMSGKASEADAQISRLEMLIDDAGVVGDQRVRMHFSLGKLYEDISEHEKAFEQYQAGNSVKRSMIEYDSKQTTTLVNSFIDFFSSDLFSKLKGTISSASQRPLFVLGMPRSGTTLVEQILASHPSVHGAGELSHIEKLVRRMPDFLDPPISFPHCLEHIAIGKLQDEADAYSSMLDRVAPDAVRVVDKMPKNFFYAGLISLMWPEAKIVWCRRDPLDTCISCFNRFFIRGQPFSWDLSELGHYFSEHERLGEHWRKVLPVEMFEVSYEELTENPEQVVRALIDFVGLSWDEQCLNFHETDRRVKTNPLQVRQPIYRTSVSRAKHFDPWIAPLKEALQLNEKHEEQPAAV